MQDPFKNVPQAIQVAFSFFELNSDNSTFVDVKKKYKILTLKYHPDKNPNNIDEATKKFKLLQEHLKTLEQYFQSNDAENVENYIQIDPDFFSFYQSKGISHLNRDMLTFHPFQSRAIQSNALMDPTQKIEVNLAYAYIKNISKCVKDYSDLSDIDYIFKNLESFNLSKEKIEELFWRQDEKGYTLLHALACCGSNRAHLSLFNAFFFWLRNKQIKIPFFEKSRYETTFLDILQTKPRVSLKKYLSAFYKALCEEAAKIILNCCVGENLPDGFKQIYQYYEKNKNNLDLNKFIQECQHLIQQRGQSYGRLPVTQNLYDKILALDFLNVNLDVMENENVGNWIDNSREKLEALKSSAILFAPAFSLPASPPVVLALTYPASSSTLLPITQQQAVPASPPNIDVAEENPQVNETEVDQAKFSKLKEKCEKLVKIWGTEIAKEKSALLTAENISRGVNGTLQNKEKILNELPEEQYNKYIVSTQSKIDAVKNIIRAKSLQDAVAEFNKDSTLTLLKTERNKYATRILRGICLVITGGLSYLLSDVKNMSEYFTSTASYKELDKILNDPAAPKNPSI